MDALMSSYGHTCSSSDDESQSDSIDDNNNRSPPPIVLPPPPLDLLNPPNSLGNSYIHPTLITFSYHKLFYLFFLIIYTIIIIIQEQLITWSVIQVSETEASLTLMAIMRYMFTFQVSFIIIFFNILHLLHFTYLCLLFLVLLTLHCLKCVM